MGAGGLRRAATALLLIASRSDGETAATAPPAVELLPIVVDRICTAGTPLTTSIHLGEDHGSIDGAARAETHAFLAGTTSTATAEWRPSP